MLFAISCTDKPDSLSLRKANREAHIAHLTSHQARILLAGPTLSDEDPNVMTGSLIVAEFEDRAAVDSFCAADPYAKAGLFAQVSIKPFKKVFSA